MKKLLVLVVIFICPFLSSQPAYAFEKVAGSSAVLKDDISKIEKPDPRVEKLRVFLGKYDSPLTPYAQNFIETADRYQLDWKLVPAISGVESSFGKQVPANSYNAYGWANGNYWFQSWEQSIEYVSSYLKEKYFNHGLDTPDKIGPVYAPPSPFWARKVSYLMKQIECFEIEDCFPRLDLTI